MYINAIKLLVDQL